MPDVVTLPQHFKNNGYFTRSLGKIYHVGIDDPRSWSVPSWHSKKPRYGPVGSAAVAKQRRDALKAAGEPIPQKGENAPFYARPGLRGAGLAPTTTCSTATRSARRSRRMRELAKKPEQPFFLAVGFANPHVPWVAPKKYWDLYRPEQTCRCRRTVTRRGTRRPSPPKRATISTGTATCRKDRKITPEFGRQCLHGYLAAISYVDARRRPPAG